MISKDVTNISDRFITLGSIVLDEFSIPLSKMTKKLMDEAIRVRNQLPKDCSHRKDKTFPSLALDAIDRALTEDTVSHCHEICLSCQQDADCPVKVSQTSFDFN